VSRTGPVAPESLRWGVVVACAAVILVASVVDTGGGPPRTLFGVGLAGYLHLVGYAGLAGAVGFALRRADHRGLLLAVGAAVCYGLAIEVVQARVARYLQRSPAPADIVFVDAPFAHPEWADAALARLAEAGWLAPSALVYVEASAHGRAPIIPAAWQRVRSQRAGDAQALLLRADAIDARRC